MIAAAARDRHISVADRMNGILAAFLRACRGKTTVAIEPAHPQPAYLICAHRARLVLCENLLFAASTPHKTNKLISSATDSLLKLVLHANPFRLRD
jgi:hypothetical protein